MTFIKMLSLISLIGSFTLQAAVQSSDEQSFCIDREDSTFAKLLVSNRKNLMGFANAGGIKNAGVCWWHSRFQRNALYLTIFKPKDPRPDINTIKQIIKNIRAGKIVKVPGYKNFAQFTSDNEELIQSELNAWQMMDGAKFAWIRGLSGSVTVTPEKLQKLMDDLFVEVEINGNIAYQKLQIKGITAHAWLVVNMVQGTDGYSLEVLDSNFPNRTMRYEYQIGDKSLYNEYYGEFTPYLEETTEMASIKRTILKLCNPELARAEEEKERAERAAQQKPTWPMGN